jgi:hypothetical protein
MMAFSRFRFALLFISALLIAYSFPQRALAHKDVIEQVFPDEDGDGPLAAAAGGSSGPVHAREFEAKTKGVMDTKVLTVGKLDLFTIVLLFSKSFGLVL